MVSKLLTTLDKLNGFKQYEDNGSGYLSPEVEECEDVRVYQEVIYATFTNKQPLSQEKLDRLKLSLDGMVIDFSGSSENGGITLETTMYSNSSWSWIGQIQEFRRPEIRVGGNGLIYVERLPLFGDITYRIILDNIGRTLFE